MIFIPDARQNICFQYTSIAEMLLKSTDNKWLSSTWAGDKAEAATLVSPGRIIIQNFPQSLRMRSYWPYQQSVAPTMLFSSHFPSLPFWKFKHQLLCWNHWLHSCLNKKKTVNRGEPVQIYTFLNNTFVNSGARVLPSLTFFQPVATTIGIFTFDESAKRVFWKKKI